jgi:hypothetical protein
MLFEGHKSGVDPRSLSAFVEVQSFIRTDEFTVDRALHLITDRALTVSNTSKIAIALLEANQLVYRAGKWACCYGCRTPCAGSTQCLRTQGPSGDLASRECQTDLQIEAEICRQFGAIVLLILPIFLGPGRDRSAAGPF